MAKEQNRDSAIVFDSQSIKVHVTNGKVKCEIGHTADMEVGCYVCTGRDLGKIPIVMMLNLDQLKSLILGTQMIVDRIESIQSEEAR